jgi:EAL domain-containing protein (putative c-di-GMP-specific phosphodiesterase class I)
MRNALKNDEFFLDYQPKITIASGKITGMEALVRWHHPRDGALLPKDFIPLAEETSLILKIDAWVLRSACHDAARWRKSGFPDLKLAVNLSALQFRDEEQLIILVEDTLKESGFPAENLELEITESMMVNDMEQAASILNRLRNLGITIFIDDFGTGYSSLAMLKQLPIQALKIDRSFVNSLEQEPKNKTFIAAIISMAEQLGLQVVVEGVESPMQLRILKDQGGTEVQGFFFSPPLGSEAFLELLEGKIPLGGGDHNFHQDQ